MAYVTRTQLENLLSGLPHLLTDLEQSADAVITMAQDWVDALLEADGVNVPITGTVPGYLSLACANYAAYILVRRKNATGGFDGLMDEYLGEATRMMRAFKSGDADVPGADAPRRNYPGPILVSHHTGISTKPGKITSP